LKMAYATCSSCYVAQILGRGLYTSPDGKPLLFASTGSEAPHSADCMINIDILSDKSLGLSPPDVRWYIYAPRKNMMSQCHHVELTLIKTRNKKITSWRSKHTPFCKWSHSAHAHCTVNKRTCFTFPLKLLSRLSNKNE
jgi:hypothetical protein